MATFTFNGSISLGTSDGIALSASETGVGANGKQLLDDTFAAASTIDFAPLIASITNPLWFNLLMAGDGGTLNFDGVGASTKAYKTFAAKIVAPSPGPAGVLALEVVTQGATQRVRFLCVGDPD